nr:hypothetical protein BaRGS_028396 [Batillaria attramentaria]
MFVCDNKIESFPYTLVCDFKTDCDDESDESFCCPQRDDERFCHLHSCPKQCRCQGLAFVCDRPFVAENTVTIRYLDASYSNMTLEHLIPWVLGVTLAAVPLLPVTVHWEFYSQSVNVAMTIFVLPVNSALNPFLYTFNLIMEKRREKNEKKLLMVIEANMAVEREVLRSRKLAPEFRKD